MSHLLKTINPEAVGEPGPAAPIVQQSDPVPMAPVAASAKLIDEAPDLTEPSPADDLALPGVGEGVAYYPRPGELRAGKGVHGAIVTAVNDDDRTLDLVVVYDADDFIGMRRVPRRSGDGNMGWERKAPDPRIAVLSERIVAIETRLQHIGKQLFGELALAEGDSLLGIIDEHEDRIDELETARPKAASAKKPQGRRKSA